MGVVWRAFDRSLGQEVALKLLLRAGDETQERRFAREGMLASTIDHPGVCRLISSGRWEGRQFLAYELVASAKTLHDVFPLARLRRRVELIRDTALALGAAHALGVVHRDVKPANVLIDMAGQVRVTDFGAAAGESLEDLTATGTLVGTPAYMAPEQITGERAAIGPPTDVWALGVMLYECVTGTSPFDAESLVEFLEKVKAGQFKPLEDSVPDLDPTLIRICLQAMEIRPEDRFPTGTAMGEALEVYLTSWTGEFAAVSPPSPGSRRLPLALSLLCLACLGVAAWALTRTPPPAASPTPNLASAGPSLASSTSPLPLSELERRARGGDSEAALQLGLLLAADPDRAYEAPRWLKAAAEAGWPAAWRGLGDLALAEDDGRRALQCWTRAIEGGDTETFARIGTAYAEGQGGVPSDWSEAVGYYRRGAEAGDPVAQERLAHGFYWGLGVKKSNAEAREWYAKAAEAGHPLGMTQLGIFEEFGYAGKPIRLAAARRWYERAAEAGDSKAKTNLGYLYQTGKGVKKDYEQALRLYRSAVAAGDHARAFERLGQCYRLGIGVAEDVSQAANLFERGVDAGSGLAARRLGDLFEDEAPTKARRWFLRGGELGDARCWFDLGILHENGMGGPKNLERAAECYGKGDEEGNLAATTALGVSYEWGNGVKQDRTEAMRLYRKAADGDHYRAMAWIGLLYRKGKGVPKDSDKALEWFRRGAAKGDKTCKNLVKTELKRRERTTATPRPAGTPDATPAPTKTP